MPMNRSVQQLRKTPGRKPVHNVSGSFQTGRVMARAWSEQLDDRRRQPAAWSFITCAVQAYADAAGYDEALQRVSPVSVMLTFDLDSSAQELAHTLGRAAATLPLEEACYQLSACYTALLPHDLRSTWGAYYTPPALSDRLMELAVQAGVDWRTARVLDPACGGGAFLLPVALRMRAALPELTGAQFLDHLETHLKGFEIDPFAAWLTQAWMELIFAADARGTGHAFPQLVTIGDSLDQIPDGQSFDLVIGNPPYGRLRLSDEHRQRYRRSLYGHANLYGLFTDLALRWTNEGGVIAYVTPTSFLAGEYFKALRGLLAAEAPPVAMDFVTARKGVFEDVLQETMLSTYRRGDAQADVSVHYLSVNGKAEVTHAGRFLLPDEASSPWLAPRTPDDQNLIDALRTMPTRLEDWGYKVSTGPLVWNRFKGQFRSRPAKDVRPVLWAEAVTQDGRFVFRAEKRNHQPYFRPVAGDDWLMTSQPCVLLQRTTAKEQTRRLIAAELPEAFIAQHGSVIVENHLNMVKPNGRKVRISSATVAAVLNSDIIDRAFRCISGSVAVSAFELEALPLPSVDQMKAIEHLVLAGKPIEKALAAIYLHGGAA